MEQKVNRSVHCSACVTVMAENIMIFREQRNILRLHAEIDLSLGAQLVNSIL